MAQVTTAQAVSDISSFIKTYLPNYYLRTSDLGVNAGIAAFNAGLSSGMSVKASYDQVIASLVNAASSFEHAFPSSPPQTGSGSETAYANSVSSAELVSFFYKSATVAQKSEIVDAINKGTLTGVDFVSAISLLNPTTSTPTLSQIVNASTSLTGTANLPKSGLSFAGLTDGQEHFLASMYIGAFGRVPEHDGFVFWGNELVKDLRAGQTQAAAYVSVGSHMYSAGASNGEGGTALNNADYIKFAYTNALGRQPDANGLSFWQSNLDSGHVQRSDFLTAFLTAGMNSERDSNYLVSRVAVGEFAAQQHVSGSQAPGIDLKGVLNGVSDIASAQTAISGINATYGVGQIEIVGIPTV